MPRKNTIKVYAPNAYYWLSNRGVNNSEIFKDEQDYRFFLEILNRHLSFNPIKDRIGRPYEKLTEKVELLAYSLMPKEFQMIIYQYESEGITNLIRRLATSYTLHYNREYNRSGGLFQSRYKAMMLLDDDITLSVSRYVHLKPIETGQDYTAYPWSSFPAYAHNRHEDWLRPDRIQTILSQRGMGYAQYAANYPEYSREAEGLKELLAD